MANLVWNTWKSKDGNSWTAGADSAYKCLLLTSGYTPDADHNFVADLTPGTYEITGGSYARQNVVTRTVNKNTSTDKYEHAANNPQFTALAGPAEPRYCAVYRVVATDADHQLVCLLDLGAGLSIVGDFMVKFNGGATSGIVFTGS
jgi:hypothetical protein